MKPTTKEWLGVPSQYAQFAVARNGQRVIVDVSDLSTGSFSVFSGLQAWSGAIFTVKQANHPDGPWVALSGVSTITASSQSSGAFSCDGYRYIGLDITTGEGSNAFVDVFFSGRSN